MNGSGPVTLSQVEQALKKLGGEATWDKILDQVTEIRNGDYSYYRNWENYVKTAYQVIQQHCQDYQKYTGPPRFEKVGKKFRLIGAAFEPISSTPIAKDIKDPTQPERVKQETYRILRDTVLAREVKESNQYRCQICGQVLKLNNEIPYAEAHHIKPLGAPHDGPDVRENILCVCPNDHVLLDYGVTKLDGEQLKSIGKEYIDYHNKHIFGRE